MKFASLLGKIESSPEALPGFVRAMEDVRGIRVLRLHGDVGRHIGPEVSALTAFARREGDVFDRPLLLDFAGTTGSDFSTVAYLVDALRRRVASSAHVGILRAPKALLAELEIAKLAGLFSVFGSEEEALAQLGSSDEPSSRPRSGR